MKKYFGLSLFLHSALLLSLIGFETNPLVRNEDTSSLRFEILSFQDGNEYSPLPQKQKVFLPESPTQIAKENMKEKLGTLSPFKPETVQKNDHPILKNQVLANSPPDSLTGNPKLDIQEFSPQVRRQQLDYAQQLKLYIEQNKFYPRSARKLKQTGLVRLQVEIDKDGYFRRIQIIEASHHENLNQAALSLIKKLGHFKPLPKEFSKETDFTIPIAYQLLGGSG